MTHTPFDADVLDRRLVESFASAHDEPRWDGEPWTHPGERLRKAGRAHSRRVAATSVLAAAGLVGGAVAGVSALTASSDQVRVIGPAGHAATGTGLDWLLTKAQYDEYTRAHPSPSPASDRVPSPAPVDDQLRTLQADVNAALPADAQTVRADAADGGVAGHALVWQRLADGTPVVVERYRLDYPLEADLPDHVGPTAPPDGEAGDIYSYESMTSPETWDDATAFTVLTGDAMGYALDRDTQWSGPIVWTVTADGWLTTWTAPVSTERLLGWAQAADARFIAGS
jgi:hypothetical protein